MSKDGTEVYQLFWDFDHLKGEKFDAMLMHFPGWEQVAGWQSTRAITTPDKIYFEANVKTLALTEYPTTDVAWPIMSSRMLQILTSLGNFKHRIVPVIMLDKKLPAGKRLDADGNPLPKAANTDYSVLQLLEQCDCFDRDRSEFKLSTVIPDRISEISKLVLKEPVDGFPPIFRLEVKASYLFVSAEARQALEQAGITGVEFRTIDKIRV
jgi:hypothetical protein